MSYGRTLGRRTGRSPPSAGGHGCPRRRGGGGAFLWSYSVSESAHQRGGDRADEERDSYVYRWCLQTMSTDTDIDSIGCQIPLPTASIRQAPLGAPITKAAIIASSHRWSRFINALQW